MPDSMETVQIFMAALLNVWPTADATTREPFFDEDAVYHNIPLEPVVGHTAIVTTFA